MLDVIMVSPSHLGKLGANAILGVSLAVCKAGAAHKVHSVIISKYVKVTYRNLAKRGKFHLIFGD